MLYALETRLDKADRAKHEACRFSDSLQESDCSNPGHLCGVLGNIKADADVTLSAQVVDFIWSNRPHDLIKRGDTIEITVYQVQGNIQGVRVLVDRVNPLRFERTRPANDPMYLLAIRKKKFGEETTILAGYSGNKCFHLAPLLNLLGYI
jgi:hypothetical protein